MIRQVQIWHQNHPKAVDKLGKRTKVKIKNKKLFVERPVL